MTTRINTRQINIKEIAHLLTQSAARLDESTVHALAGARRNALQRQTSRSPIFMLDTGRWAPILKPHSVQRWVTAGLFMTMLVGTASYLQHSHEQKISDLDVAILTDELPIEVFVD